MRVLGFMSGTSLDGVDGVLLETDGKAFARALGQAFVPYPTSLQAALHKAMACLSRGENDPGISHLAYEITQIHLEVARLLAGQGAPSPELVGFHGQTLYHNPARRISLQIGQPQILADTLSVPVIHTFRQKDLEAGGQGAPLVPIYHACLAKRAPRPCIFVNIGGISNLTWCSEEELGLYAFDAGPGNAPLNDWVLRHFRVPYDKDGELAKGGQVHAQLAQAFLAHPYFAVPFPKALDRGTFDYALFEELAPQDGAATLTYLAAAAIALGIEKLPPSQGVYVCGGGRHNKVLMGHLKRLIPVPVNPVEDLGMSADFLEAEAFAYLAMRSYRGLPLSFPGTTGVPSPALGGVCTLPTQQQKGALK